MVPCPPVHRLAVQPGRRDGRVGGCLAWPTRPGRVPVATRSSLDRVDVGTASWHLHTYSLQRAHTATPERKDTRPRWAWAQTWFSERGPTACIALGRADAVWFGRCGQTGNMTGDWWKKPFPTGLASAGPITARPLSNTEDSRKLPGVDACRLSSDFYVCLFVLFG